MPILPSEPDRYPLDLFNNGENPQAPPWWVARVRPRREKCLARLLGGEEIAFYLPLQRRRAGVANASRVASVPLFPGYLFFQGEGRERLRAFETGAILTLLSVDDQERLHRELKALSLLQGADLPLETASLHRAGDEIRIVRGPLQGLEGVVVRTRSSCRLVVRITALGTSVVAEVEAAWVATGSPVPKRAARNGYEPSGWPRESVRGASQGLGCLETGRASFEEREA